jgi:glycosyltransferase involved in cell wall biosynthesis
MDIMHSHGLWVMPNVYPGQAARSANTPLIVSPRGTLSAWALDRGRWKKRVFWRLMQRSAIDNAVCFHATAESEFDDIRRNGFTQPVCVVPNGIDIPDLFPADAGTNRVRKLLFLGRIHPGKGLDILLHAWGEVQRRFSAWELEIVGPDNDGYLAEMRQMASDLRLPRVYFRGPLFGAGKTRAFQDADIFVLPTRTENFGMTVAEALASGTPAIVSRGAPWGGLENHGAGWWIDIGVDPLIACLEQAMEYSPERLMTMGMSGRQWMQEEFSWDRVATMMLGTYRWIRNGGEVPEWVRC